MAFPLFILCILSIFVGYLTKDLFIGFGTDYWGPALFVSPYKYVLSDIEFLDVRFKLLPLIVTLLGASSSFLLYKYGLKSYYNLKQTSLFIFFYTFFNKKWYFDRIYNEFISQNALISSYNYFYKTIDRGLIEKVGPFGIVNAVKTTSTGIKKYQTGNIRNYLIYFTIFIFVIIICKKIIFFI